MSKVEFFDNWEAKLCMLGLDYSDDYRIPLSLAWEMIFKSDSIHHHFKRLRTDHCDIYYMKGLVNPVSAMMAIRQFDIFSTTLDVSHVWLRTSVDSRVEYDYCVEEGSPGWGGSYKATVVYTEPNFWNPYKSFVDRTNEKVFSCDSYNMEAHIVDSWNRFKENLRSVKQ